MLKHCGAARFAYNWGLARRIEEYQKSGRVLTSIDLHRELNLLKRSRFPWFYEVSKCAPHEALRDLDRAFGQYLKGRKNGKRVGFPRFKSRRGRKLSCRLNGVIRVSNKAIQLPRLGRLRLKEANYLPSGAVHVLSATIVGRAGRWYVSLRVVDEINIIPNGGPRVGVDVGLTHFATLLDGQAYEPIRPRRKLQRRIRRLSRALARRKKGGANREKTAIKLARLHCRIADIRKNYLHKITTQLTKTKSVIVIEDLSIRGLQRTHRLGMSLADAALREFRRQLDYKAAWYGAHVVVAPRFFPSSQLCSECGRLNRDIGMCREFVCPECGYQGDRDLNAARNLLAVAASSAETQNACGATSSDWLLPVQLVVTKQEPDVEDLENGKVIGVT